MLTKRMTFSMVLKPFSVIYVQGSMLMIKERFPFFTSLKMISFIHQNVNKDN
mgnify:CR=1 FL=1